MSPRASRDTRPIGVTTAKYTTPVIRCAAVAELIAAAQVVGRQGFERLRAVRSDVPAVTHVDYSARLQTVDGARHGRFDTLLRTFEAKTGCPVMVNTSFNVRGEPIVRTPDDAWRCFRATGMDALVLGRSVLLKERQPEGARVDAEAHLARFEMD